MSPSIRLLLGITTLITLLGLFLIAKDAGDALSPQGCRMSWMSPSYVLQTSFNESWSPLATRYSLWLYREVGWNAAKIGNSLPVLFIPGNAGSSHQARSIASSTARQYYGSPGHMSPEFISRTDTYRPLDVYTVEFNEDLSAFHGTTLQSQIDYTSQAISYILSLYPPNTRVLVMGHSMGGIVATSLLPSAHISAIITMATPFAMPPARFEASVDAVYHRVHEMLAHDPTPILSLCGGATDKMIPSESCIIPRSTASSGWRRTIFTSALEGSWTGVGHEVIVWCHQVRWRIARAALELGPLRSRSDVVDVLDRWLRDGQSLPGNVEEPSPLTSEELENSKVVDGLKLTLVKPQESGNYRLKVPNTDKKLALTMLVSQGTINSIGPHRPIPLKVSIYQCTKGTCSSLPPTTLKSLPSPILGKPFPVPKEGSDESEGVVLFEGDLLSEGVDWVVVRLDQADGRGWIAASIEEDAVIHSEGGTFAAITGGIKVPLSNSISLKQELSLPYLLSDVLIAYRVQAVGTTPPSCNNVLFPPLIAHKSNQDEVHYFPQRNPAQPRAILHTHSPAPFIPNPEEHSRGIHLNIYSSGLSECKDTLEAIYITVDWATTLSRWATRYWMSALAWSVGVVALVTAYSWDSNGRIAPVKLALERFTTKLLPRLMGVTLLLSFVPFSKTRYLGTGGEPWFSAIAPLILVISTGLVILMWWILSGLLAALRKLASLSPKSDGKAETVSVSRNTLASITIVCLAIFLFIPWQVAFLGCWTFHLFTCASTSQVSDAHRDRSPDVMGKVEEQEMKLVREDNANFNGHLLLLMTWLLPLVAPILAVWVRTLMTAGYTTPFNGDHNVLNVLPFLILVDFTSWTPARLFTPTRFEKWLQPRWLFAAVGAIAFIFGSRNPYVVFRAVSSVVGVLVCTGVGRRYWQGVRTGV
ncbi:GPI inositol-deacylase [Coprinopsis sp. MPI-PUGE-AT-0042]|nr:GPI inositol-deacylase [Coprinopsis sp. MPI-PUGE-AT-0042]